MHNVKHWFTSRTLCVLLNSLRRVGGVCRGQVHQHCHYGHRRSIIKRLASRVSCGGALRCCHGPFGYNFVIATCGCWTSSPCGICQQSHPFLILTWTELAQETLCHPLLNPPAACRCSNTSDWVTSWTVPLVFHLRFLDATHLDVYDYSLPITHTGLPSSSGGWRTVASPVAYLIRASSTLRRPWCSTRWKLNTRGSRGGHP